MKHDRLNGGPWPARMKADLAARYMDVSLGSFMARYGTLGVKEGANKLWAKEQMDAIVRQQFSLGQAAQPAEDSTWDDVR